jgi:hypothetical protein
MPFAYPIYVFRQRLNGWVEKIWLGASTGIPFGEPITPGDVACRLIDTTAIHTTNFRHLLSGWLFTEESSEGKGRYESSESVCLNVTTADLKISDIRFRVQFSGLNFQGSESIMESMALSTKLLRLQYRPLRVWPAAIGPTHQPSASISYAFDLCFGSNRKFGWAGPRNISL